MASNRGYTTAQKVKDAMAGMVAGYYTDAMIETVINGVEGLIDANLKIALGSNISGSNTITFATTRPVHCIIERAATYGAALGLCGPSALSWNTLDQLVNAQNLFSYLFKTYMDAIESDMLSDMITGDV